VQQRNFKGTGSDLKRNNENNDGVFYYFFILEVLIIHQYIYTAISRYLLILIVLYQILMQIGKIGLIVLLAISL